MKIIKFLFTNYRSIGSNREELIFENNDIIFLIGKNSSGKSTIMEGYDFFVNSKLPTIYDFNRRNSSCNIEIEAEFEIENSENEDIEPWDQISKYVYDKKLHIKQVWNKIGMHSEFYFYNKKNSNYNPVSRELGLKLLALFPKPVWIRGMDTINESISQLQVLLNKGFSYEFVSKGGLAFKKERGKTTAEIFSKHGVFTELEALYNSFLKDVFPEASFKPFLGPDKNLPENLHGKQKGHLLVEQGGMNFGFDYNGDAIKRVLLVTSELIKDELEAISQGKEITLTKKMILFEEPELFGHPDSIRSMRNLLYKLSQNPNYNIICTTHSPVMIDLAREHSALVRVKFIQGLQTKIFQVNGSVFSNVQREKMRLLITFDPYVCEAFFAEKVLLVEGDTEYIATNTIISILKRKGILREKDYIHVVNCRSKTNLSFFQEVLRHFQIQYYVFHDLDDTYKKNGHKNSAWTENEKIWEEIEKARNSFSSEVRRYIFLRNFEQHNRYRIETKKGKPYSAYEMVLEIEKQLNKRIPKEKDMKPILKYVLHIFGKLKVSVEDHDDQFVNNKRNKKKK
ncbi:ATP-dependent nuclease [Bacillus thuringiensis]|uniref:ATP-dependent nuclease n=1 Tax=Bacillus thuringiensis TaxID=1428 RepID=UPI00159BED40|nr:AAA family ATPase [Bacillus thuringiensis]